MDTHLAGGRRLLQPQHLRGRRQRGAASAVVEPAAVPLHDHGHHTTDGTPLSHLERPQQDTTRDGLHSHMADTMRAVVLDAPGPVENLDIRDLPVPEPPLGWVRIKVLAFGLNRSELHTRLGLADGVTLPRVLGIEAVGVVDAAPDGDLAAGQQVGLHHHAQWCRGRRGGTARPVREGATWASPSSRSHLLTRVVLGPGSSKVRCPGGRQPYASTTCASNTLPTWKRSRRPSSDGPPNRWSRTAGSPR